LHDLYQTHEDFKASAVSQDVEIIITWARL
jgi:hypothetical protein